MDYKAPHTWGCGMHRRIPAGIEFRRSSAGLGGDPPYPPLLRGEKKGGSFGIAISRLFSELGLLFY